MYKANEFDIGDRVLIKSKISKFYLETGVIKNTFQNSEYLVAFDFIDNEVVFDEYKLVRIENVVEVPTGEVVIIPHDNLFELISTGILKYNNEKKYFYFDINNRWEIDRFSY